MGQLPHDAELLHVNPDGGSLRCNSIVTEQGDKALVLQPEEPFAIVYGQGQRLFATLVSLDANILDFLFSYPAQAAVNSLVTDFVAQGAEGGDKNTLHQRLRSITQDSMAALMADFSDRVEPSLL